MTGGVGNDILAETSLQNYLPNTKFYGSDPIEESGKIFKEIGQYHQIALSSKSATVNSSVLIGVKYVWRKVEAVTIETFLEKTRSLNVDYLFLDIEGAEYDILPQMVEDGSETKSAVICQINIELHGPLKAYDMDSSGFSRKGFTNIPIWKLHIYQYG